MIDSKIELLYCMKNHMYDSVFYLPVYVVFYNKMKNGKKSWNDDTCRCFGIGKWN